MGYAASSNTGTAARPFFHFSRFILYVFLIIPFFEPLSLTYIASANAPVVFDYWRFVESLFIIFVFMTHDRLSKPLVGIFLFCVVYFGVSLLTSIRWTLQIFFIADILGLFMLVEMAIKKDGGLIFYSMYCYLFLLVLANYVLMIKNPNGVYQYVFDTEWNPSGYYNVYYDTIYFLERRNRLMNFLMPLWISSFMSYNLHYIKKIPVILAVVLIDLTLLSGWSATSLIGGAFLTFASILILFFGNYLKKLSLGVFAFFAILANMAVLQFHVQDWFATFIQNVLKRNTTLSGRTDIWSEGMAMFYHSPIFGYGTRDKGYIIDGNYGHNFCLDLLLEGGILLLLAFIYCIYCCWKSGELSLNQPAFHIIVTAFFVLGIMGVVESFFYQYMFWLTLSFLSGIRFLQPAHCSQTDSAELSTTSGAHVEKLKHELEMKRDLHTEYSGHF